MPQTQHPLSSPLYCMLSGVGYQEASLEAPWSSWWDQHWADLSPESWRKQRLRNAWDWSAPLPHHCMLGWVGHCIPGGPGKTGGSWAAATGSVLSQGSNVCWPPASHFSTQCATQFFWETLNMRIFVVGENLKRSSISGVQWTPGDHFSKHCFLYYNELCFRQTGRQAAVGKKIELINPAAEGTMRLKRESWGGKSWFISLITPLWSLYLIPVDLKRK